MRNVSYMRSSFFCIWLLQRKCGDGCHTSQWAMPFLHLRLSQAGCCPIFPCSNLWYNNKDIMELVCNETEEDVWQSYWLRPGRWLMCGRR